ncbi:MAG: hypothetical protein EPO51_04095 [Phenylobacterium sp.]|uniref:hypothetical protein n=1 Tax=Phenylobacterium sp. TaxID=1871053 RepID=UPI00121713B3|nr:hypothetical protein [Phenylobacterium sp.]TAJ73667.1 MAG: hypothetical protein EPO51_04095 [Phenylobacterium sp.]
MDPASIAIAMMLVSAQPSAKEMQERATPIRCRPAPYYIAERTGKQIPRILLDTPKGRSIAVIDKRGRPCHLTRTPNEGRTTFRNAD